MRSLDFVKEYRLVGQVLLCTHTHTHTHTQTYIYIYIYIYINVYLLLSKLIHCQFPITSLYCDNFVHHRVRYLQILVRDSNTLPYKIFTYIYTYLFVGETLYTIDLEYDD